MDEDFEGAKAELIAALERRGTISSRLWQTLCVQASEGGLDIVAAADALERVGAEWRASKGMSADLATWSLGDASE